jgi:8-oxo-dGTP pyrophosphatase MutT (NUDIX family)
MALGTGGQQHIPRPPSYRLGEPAPWQGVPPEMRRLSLADVRARLADLPPAKEAIARAESSQAAAVLVPMYEEHGEAHVVLIKRPQEMPSHRGEIAFPGGKVEPKIDRDLEATALREAKEEVGLAPEDVEIVAQLDGLGTVASRFTITPFVGFLHGRPALTPNPREVTRVLFVPLSDLLDDAVYREERWDPWLEGLGVQFYELHDETVWGATARILTNFLTHLIVGR